MVTVPKYAPRPKATPIPGAHWNEAPCYCLQVNGEWLSHILGVLIALDQPDTWDGTKTEVEDARHQVNEIMACFMKGNEMCCCGDSTPAQPILHRVTVDGRLEVSYDGGLTWEPDPEDERLTAPALPPPVTSGESATKCDAATNGLEHLKDYVAAVSEQLAVAGVATTIAGAIATFICVSVLLIAPETFPAIYPLLVAAATAAFSVGQSAFDAAFTNTVWDDMLCILYCHIEDDGHFTEGGFSAVLADIPVKITDSIANYQLREIIKGMGIEGLNNICSYGNAALSDCSACDCACSNNFTAAQGTPLETPYYEGYTSYQSVFNGEVNAIVITTAAESVCCQVLDVKFDLVGETGNAFNPFAIYPWDCDVSWDDPNSAGPVTGKCLSRIIATTHPTLNPDDVFVMSILFAECDEEE